jgi:hypothetical protein
MVFDGGVTGSSEFAAALSRLKQRGSALLVVGNVTQELHQLACRQLMGDLSMHRQRLFITTDGSSTDVRSAIAGETRHRNHVIEYSTNCRSAVESEAGTGAGGPQTEPAMGIGIDAEMDSETASYTSACSPSDLTAAIVHNIQNIEREAEPLAQGELRVCIDSLSPLIESNHREIPLRLVRYTAIVTQRRQGIVHAHLPVSPNTELAYLFEPLVDAVVELRIIDGSPQQRWHLLDDQMISDWTELSE